ncbi:acetyl-CoA synthetase-like protein [Trichodelitschia bisporula]|uniref:Acetyl-CoA synthetase-like protein n=1 Tax=Trichodelitschia bisporula TaxID=703511 RepID=A0A6G1I051_9PEZI|nr:acetyl-CoA synthetase-like protein [Trichodelitschia bisporula]
MPTKSPYPDIDIPDVDLWGFIFERKNRPFPDSQVVFRDVHKPDTRVYTFADVRKAAITFGTGLRSEWDWAKNEVLALYTPNDIDVPAIIYGTLWAGGIVTPANPAYSAEELAFQLKDAEAKALVTTVAYLDTALKAAAKCGIPTNRVLVLGEKDEQRRVKHWTQIVNLSRSSYYRRRKANPDKDLAFLVYSSGTTGLPKGVMLSHRNMVSVVLQNEGGGCYVYGRDKYLAILPFYHIYALTTIVHQMLHRGFEAVVMPAFEMKTFLKAIQEHRITMVYVAPPVIVRLARDPEAEKYDLSSLLNITSGAAPLTGELVHAIHKKFGIKITQAYGLSETSPTTHIQPWDEWLTALGSVGKLVPNMTAKYISEDGTEAAPGQPGELWLSGPNVFKGYWKNPTATAASITEDGYFKTGDVGFADDQHNFYITDRLKELIKYKGFQVAPAELEGKLLAHPNVADVAVIGVMDTVNHTEVPRAYVVAAADGAKTSEAGEEIVEWLSQQVAHHKRLRGGVVFVDEIPKSASGKILRRILKERAKKEGVKAKL